MTRRIFGTGGTGLGGSEKWMVITGPTYTTGGRVVVVGFGQTNTSPARRLDDLELLARAGFVVICMDLGGSALWSNDTQLAAVDAALAWAAANFGADTSKVSWVGDSRFAMLALLWSWLHPTRIGAVCIRIPVVAFGLLHDQNRAGLAAEIEAAYLGLAGYQAALPSRDPSHPTNVTKIITFKDRVRAWYSLNDPIVLPSDVTSWQALTGVDIRPLGNVTHDPWTPGAIDGYDQARWIYSKQ